MLFITMVHQIEAQVQQAITCNKIWRLDNGISLSYRCHKNLEKLKTKNEKHVCYFMFSIPEGKS